MCLHIDWTGMFTNYYGIGCSKFGFESAVKRTLNDMCVFGVKKMNVVVYVTINKLANDFTALVTSGLGPDVASLVAEKVLANIVIFFFK